MKALSIRQPWAWAIVHAGKRCENRDWPAHMIPRYRGPLLIHASKTCTRAEYMGGADFMREVYETHPWDGETMLPGIGRIPRGVIVARAQLVAIMHTDDNAHRVPLSAVGVPDCRLCGYGLPPATCSRRDPWAIPGALGLILADVEPIEVPIPFRGSLGLFEVPDELLLLRGARFERARP